MKFFKGDKITAKEVTASSDPLEVGKRYTVAKDACGCWVSLEGKTGLYNTNKVKACNRRKPKRI